MPVMDIRHMSVLMLGEWMIVFVGMMIAFITVCMELVIVAMDMFVQHRHMDVEMGVFFIRQQPCACHHQQGSDTEQQCYGVLEDENGQQHTCQRSCAIQGAGARRAQSAHGVDEEHGAESVADEAEQENAQDGAQRWEALTKPKS
jgi:hypothetical protein